MKNLINKKVLETVKFSTNTVGPLAYLVHKMSGKGSYILEVYRGDKPSYSMGIECSEKHNKTSEQIDLSGFENKLMTKMATSFSIIRKNLPAIES